MSKHIQYKDGYKFQLFKQFERQTNIYPTKNINTDFISLTLEGLLTIRPGYAWDGSSGPTFNTINFRRPSLAHDAFYQLMRLGLLSSLEWREPADKLLREMCIEDSMWKIRAWWVYRGVRLGGASAASTASKKKIHTAP